MSLRWRLTTSSCGKRRRVGDGSQQVVVAFNPGTPPSYQITIRWDEPTPDNSVPQYSINVPVNPF